MFRIYTKEKISKEIFNVNLDSNELQIVMGGNVFLDHPDLNKDDYIVVEQEYAFKYPTYRADKNIIEEMTLYEAYKNGLYELQPHQVEHKGDLITLQPGQYIDPKGELITVPKIEGIRIEWDWDLHEWQEKATMLEIVQAQYTEYEGMDTVSTVREMEKIDPAMADEFVNMLIELRQIAYSLNGTAETQSVGYSTLPIPKPSKTLQEYLDMRKVIKIGKNN